MDNRSTPDGREQRGDRTAQALMRAASTAFSERGYAGASVRDIADDAGANPALIRYHFGSKQGLYRRIIDDAIGRLRQRVAIAADGKADSILRVQAMVDALIDFMAAERDFPRLVQRALLDGNSELDGMATECLGPLREGLNACMRGREAEVGDVLSSLWAAAVMPFTYASMLDPFLGRDLMSSGGLHNHRQHMHLLLQQLLNRAD